MPYLRTLLIALPILALLGGCATNKPAKPTPPAANDSQALKIMKGAHSAKHYKLDDVSRDRIKQSAQDGEPVTRSLDAAAGATSIVQGTTAVDALGGSALLMSAFGSGTYDQAEWLDAYAWVPADKADTRKEAADVLARALEKGVKKTLAEDAWDDFQVIQEGKKNDNGDYYRYLAVLSSDGKPSEVLFSLSALALYSSMSPKPLPKPHFLGSKGKVWGAYSGSGDYDIGGFNLYLNPDFTENNKRFPYRGQKLAQYGLPKNPSAFVKELSGNLPEWIAFYIGPKWDKSKEYPRVYWQGKELVFVEPDQK